MREGQSHPIEHGGEERSEIGREDRAFQTIDRLLTKFKPDSRPGRFLATMGFVTALMAGTGLSGEAHAEPTGAREHQVEKLEKKAQRYDALVEHGGGGLEDWRRKTYRELDQARREWLEERKEDLKHVDLRKDEALLGKYKLSVSSKLYGEEDRRLFFPDELGETRWDTREAYNVLVCKNGELTLNIDTYKVEYQEVGPHELHILGFNINGSVDVYVVKNGSLVDERNVADDTDLPYEEYQKKGDKEWKRAHFLLKKHDRPE